MTTTQTQRTGRTLVKPILFDKLATRITKDHPELDQPMAERITEQALAFLATAATATQPIGPSNLVDIGWHTFLLHTRDYTAFCDRIAGRYIHHEPETGSETGVPLTTTVKAMRAAGFRIDPDLWPVGNAECESRCTQCHAGCTNSPTQ